jgi:NAD(P)-dependent dehydrogenase (short-subunit alcohol dehydrogenase family)
MPSAVLIGANRGLGLGFAKNLLRAGYDLHATVRDPNACSELMQLGESCPQQLHVYPFEVTNAESRRHFVDTLAISQIDLLIHNAGIYGPPKVPLGTIDEETWKQVLWVDTVAPLLLVQDLLPRLRAADAAKIALLTSKVGSIADNDYGACYFYRSAKAGLNAAGRSLAIDLTPEGISVILLHPGWVRTDMGGEAAPLEVPESVAGMLQQIEQLSIQTTGRFVDYSGAHIPW